MNSKQQNPPDQKNFQSQKHFLKALAIVSLVPVVGLLNGIQPTQAQEDAEEQLRCMRLQQEIGISTEQAWKNCTGAEATPEAPTASSSPSFELAARRIPMGSTLPATYPAGVQLVIRAGEIRPASLSLTGTSLSDLTFPPGTWVHGQFQPTAGGVQFNAYALEINGTRYPFQAVSSVFPLQPDPSVGSHSNAAGQAMLGAALGSLIGGRVSPQRILSTTMVSTQAHSSVPQVAIVSGNALITLSVSQEFVMP